jgi:hypothetical protein
MSAAIKNMPDKTYELTGEQIANVHMRAIKLLTGDGFTGDESVTIAMTDSSVTIYLSCAEEDDYAVTIKRSEWLHTLFLASQG